MTARITEKDVAERAGVNLDDLKQDYSDDISNGLSELCDPWRLAGEHLKLTSQQLNAIDENHKKVEEKRIAVLKKRTEGGFDATYLLLVEAFLAMEKAKYALEVCEIFKKSHSSRPSNGREAGAVGTLSKEPGLGMEAATHICKTDKKAQTTKPDAKKLRTFSDSFSPQELCGWLALQLKEKGLELKKEQQDAFLKDEINGLSFRKLKDSDLQDMGFKRGPRMTILEIISSLSVEVRSSIEEPDGPSKSALITPDAPPRGCTMGFSPRTTLTRTSGSGSISEGAAPACMPYKGHLWRKDKLVVEFNNVEYLAEWGLTPKKFLEYANRWSTGANNHIPKFELNNNSPSDIIVKLSKDGKRECDPVGYHANSYPTTISLDLCHNDQKYREHLIVHEFGHALGLGHEHQRSKLWQLINNFIDTNKIMFDPDVDGQYESWIEDEQIDVGGGTEDYDPDSIMHYWFKRDWLKDGYRDENTIIRNGALTEDAKRALLGILRCDGNVKCYPSPNDLKFLNNQYKNTRNTSQSRVPEKRGVPQSSRGAEPPSKRSRVIVDSGADSNVQEALSDFSGLEEVTNGFLDLIEWNGGKNKLRIYSMSAAKWKIIATKLGLEDDKPGFINGLARRHRDEDEECVREVFRNWLDNAIGLRNASHYPKSWDGLCKLLDDSKLGEIATKLRTALTAPDCNVRRK